LLNNRQQQQGRRRGRGRNPQGGGNRNENGSRIDNRARGNAPQMLEKYKNLARDAQLQGDRVMTEYYLQFSDHYFRIVAEQRARFEEQRSQRDDWQGEDGSEGEPRSQVESLDDEADGYNDQQDYRQQQSRPQREPQRDQQREPYRDQQRDTARRDTNRDTARDTNRDTREAREPNRDTRTNREYQDREPRRNNGRNGNVAREEVAEAPATLDISVLPPAFASDGPMTPIDLDDGLPVAAAPKRRGRPRKVDAELGGAAE
jgi:Domain of unknown function (DUF4167)